MIAARRFVFLRHGETEGNRLRFFQPPDQPLNDAGLAQAAQAAEIVAALRPARLVASTMRRAQQTAAFVARACGLPVEECDGVRERFFGQLIGTSSANLDWEMDPPGGETLAAFEARTLAALRARLDGPDLTVVVAHGGTLRALRTALDVAAPLRNATPLLFEKDEGWRVETLPLNGGGLLTV